MKKHILIPGLVVIMILVTMMACQILSTPATTDPNIQNTQVALALTQAALNNPTQDQNLVKTQVALALTQSALNNPTENPNLANTQQALAQTQAALNNPTQNPNMANTQQALAQTQTAMSVVPTATITQQNLQAQIASANILIYEDIASSSSYIPYVQEALKSVGGHQTYVADAMGTFMNDMNSGTKWDLIVVASELRTAISGDYWTILKQKVDGGSALVTEIWYLNMINGGKIAPFLTECGIDVERDWQGASVYNPINYGMYWMDPSSPVFNTPNKVNAFRNSLTTTAAWMYGDLGDIIKVTDSSKGTLLASLHTANDGLGGLIASCMKGTVLFQTFSSHNYPTNDMVALWQNYMIYTLTNHFQGH